MKKNQAFEKSKTLIENGFSLLKVNNIQLANKYINEAEKLNIKNSSLLLELAKFFNSIKNHEKFKFNIHKAIKYSKNDNELKLNICDFLIKINYHALAMEQLKIIVENKSVKKNILLVAVINLASCYVFVEKLEEAIKLYTAFKDNFCESFEFNYNFANALSRNGKVVEAVDFYKKAHELDKNHPWPLHNLASAYSMLGNLDHAARMYQNLICVDPSNNEARSALSIVHLKLGDFKQGWHNYRYRWKDNVFRNSESSQSLKYAEYFKYPENLAELSRKRIAIICEQGIGDDIMFYSTIPDLISCGAIITIIAKSRLTSLLANSFSNLPIKDINKIDFDTRDFDFIVPAGDLPYFFRNHANDFPKLPYLVPSNNSILSINKIYNFDRSKLNVGIAWRGGSIGTGSKYRSLDPTVMAKLVNHKDINVVSLQYGEIESEIEIIKQNIASVISPYKTDILNEIDMLAALIAELDLIITVQNSNVHICGALGKNCIVMLPHSPEWRYGIVADQMSWYGSVELFRQTKLGDWTDVIEKVKKRLYEELI